MPTTTRRRFHVEPEAPSPPLTDSASLADALCARPSQFDLGQMLRLAALEGWPVVVAADPSRTLTPSPICGWRLRPSAGGPGVLVAAVGPVAGRASRLGPTLRRRLADDPEGERALVDAVDTLTDQVARREHEAWRRARPHVDHEAAAAASGTAPGRDDPFVATLLGLAPAAVTSGLVGRSSTASVAAEAAAFAAGALRRGGTAAFAAAASHYFGVRVRLRPVAGDPSRYRLRVGPLRLSQYRDFLPPALGGTALVPLLLWARAFVGPARRPQVELTLRADAVPPFVARRTPTPDAARAGWLGWARRPGAAARRPALTRISAIACVRILETAAPDRNAGAGRADSNSTQHPGRRRP